MAIPSFLSPRPLHTPPTASAASALGGSGPTSPQASNINITVQVQEQSDWCWAAVAVSVESFYDPTSRRSQCELAGEALGRTDCCSDGASDPQKCNRPWYLDRALTITGNLLDMRSSATSFAGIQRNVANDTPLCCRIGWYGGGGHFAVVKGWRIGSGGDQYLNIADPFYLEQEVAFNEFPSLYHGGGNWTHSYLTTPASLGGATVTVSTSPDDPDTLGA
ncbi:hypothetical protein DK419_03850 [Methylobacterium terrae]|uniref:Peptidase C39-like domain-containing protein n=1 Tax=Methylobacterium terrae TaxID=2202827 RepID=A0A2U8WJ81_9HYPH|nr:papain-like cysteine protease family protein [Methylobacterium terrae]AWN45561.1 hypothetical protein DK419_03850 [Methylobacterium terrae]